MLVRQIGYSSRFRNTVRKILWEKYSLAKPLLQFAIAIKIQSFGLEGFYLDTCAIQ